ncbi:MAG TPA: hypothetical protein VGX03_21960, partial [Candidatus Binatia bacterium]|nr:hypothetical protein [Candidatus Binatia bacterium]
MLKLLRPTNVRRGVGRCGGLLIASALVLWLVAASSATAQERRMPPIRGGVEERVERDLPTAQGLAAPPLKGGVDESFERGLPPTIGDRSDRSYEEDCRAFQELMELNRKALRSPEVTRSQAWHDAEHNLFDYTSSNTSSEFHRHLMMHCHCPVVSGRARIEQWWEWQIRNAPQDARTQILEHLETEIERTEACYKKACEEPAPPPTQASDQSPCPPSTLAVTASGPLRRPAPREEPAPADLQRELETLRVDLDRFWQEQYERNDVLLYKNPSRLIQCRERNCFYQ